MHLLQSLKNEFCFDLPMFSKYPATPINSYFYKMTLVIYINSQNSHLPTGHAINTFNQCQIFDFLFRKRPLKFQEEFLQRLDSARVQRGSSHVCCKFFQQIHPIFRGHRNRHNMQPRHPTKQMPRKKIISCGQCKYTIENLQI